MKFFTKKRIYLDYAASAPVLGEARRAFERAELLFANPSAIHKDGVAAKEALSNARAAVAKVLHAHPDEVIFMSTGTESDNTAAAGAFFAAKRDGVKIPHMIALETEHPAILEKLSVLKNRGGEITLLPVGADGRVDPKVVRNALRPETVLVSIMYANNEIGVVQPIRDIAKEIRHYKKEHGGVYPLFHTDACQAAPYLNMNVEQLGVDMLSLSGIKIGGGHGASVLYLRRGTPIFPIMHGGGQEYGLRPGTENVPAVAALAEALRIAESSKERESSRLAALRDYFFTEARTRFPEIRINGDLENRLPSNIHISFPNITSELLVLELDARGISVSAGSACSASDESESPVLAALYGSGDGKKWGSIRISMGSRTTKNDLAAVLTALTHILKKYRSLV